MKTKLRKEFEEYVKKTEKRLWELENPPKFKYGDKLWYIAQGDHDKTVMYPCVYKGEKKTEEDNWGGDKSHRWFDRFCIIDTKECLTDINERYLYTEDQLSDLENVVKK